jgi:pilus assembly protein CpaE
MFVLSAKTEERRGALRVLLVGEDEARRTEIKRALAALPDPQLEVLEASPRASEADNGGAPADVEMVVFGGEEEVPLQYLQYQAAQSPRPILFALLPERAPNLMRRVLRAGADELLFLPLDAGDATRALLKISEARRRAERQAGGMIISLISTLGGVGLTSLAANLGLAARHSHDKRVGLLDLDLQTGGLAVYLNVEPSRSIMDVADPEKKLDSIQLESALTKHPSGLYLLAAPKRIEDSEMISDVTVGAVLDLMRQLFDVVVVDCGSHVNATSVAAWERSDRLLYVIDQSIAAARCAWRFIELFQRLGLHGVEPAFVLSRYSSQHPITDAQLANTLGRPLFTRIPRDDKAIERVQLRGQDLWQAAPNSALAKAVDELSSRLSSPGGYAPVEQAGGAKLLSKLRGAFGALGGARSVSVKVSEG